MAYDLPTTITYHQIQQVCALLAPKLPIDQIIMIEIDPRYVAIKRRRMVGRGGTVTTTIPIEHEQGAYTEGGAPTPPPTPPTEWNHGGRR
jgi:hypothetical protein